MRDSHLFLLGVLILSSTALASSIEPPPRVTAADFAKAHSSTTSSSSRHSPPSYPSSFDLIMRVESWMAEGSITYRFAMAREEKKASIYLVDDPSEHSVWRGDLTWGVSSDGERCRHFPFTDEKDLPPLPGVPEEAVFVGDVSCTLVDGTRTTCQAWNLQHYYDTWYFFHGSQPVLIEEWLPRQSVLAYKYTPTAWSDAPADDAFDVPSLCNSPPSIVSMDKSWQINRGVWTHTNPEDPDDYRMTWVGQLFVSEAKDFYKSDALYMDWEADKWMRAWIASDGPLDTTYAYYEPLECIVGPGTLETPVPERFRSGHRFVGMGRDDSRCGALTPANWCERWEVDLGNLTEVIFWDSELWGPIYKGHYALGQVDGGEPLREWWSMYVSGEPDPEDLKIIDVCLE